MRFWIAFIPFYLILIGCEQPVDLDIMDDQQLVVISNFSDLDTLEVVVSVSESVLDTNERPTYLSDALVEVLRRGQFADVLEFVAAGNEIFPSFYRANKLVPEEGERYTIQVSAPGFDPVEGTDFVPFSPEIDTANVNLELEIVPEDLFFNRVDFSIQFILKDPEVFENYYHLNFFQQGFNYRIGTGGDTIKQQFFSLPLSVETDEAFPIQPYFNNRGVLLADAPFNGQDQVLTFTGSFVYRSNDQLLGDFVIEVRSVTETYFKYHTSLARQFQASGDPLADPVILYSNIEGGQGVFAGFNSAFYVVGTGQ